MAALPVKPRVCAICGEIHRHIAAHLRHVHHQIVESDNLDRFLLDETYLPKVSIIKSFLVQQSRANAMRDLRLSFLSNGEVALTQEFTRPLLDSNRTLNLKRKFRFRRELQYIWYDREEKFSLHYTISTIRYSYNKIELLRKSTLLSAIDRRHFIFNRRLTTEDFSRIVFNPMILEFSSRQKIMRKNYRKYVPSALIFHESAPIFVHYEETIRNMQEANRSALIAEARRLIEPYPLICVNDEAAVLKNVCIKYNNINELPIKLKEFGPDIYWRRV